MILPSDDWPRGEGSRRSRPTLPAPATDTANHFNVVAKGDEVLVLRPKGGPMTKPEAANMGLWLLAHSGLPLDQIARGLLAIKAK